MYNSRDDGGNGPKKYYSSNPYNQAWHDWLELRKYNPERVLLTNEIVFGESGKPNLLCYCGHTKYCECEDPDIQLFKKQVENGNIKLGDKDNGWKEPPQTGSLNE